MRRRMRRKRTLHVGRMLVLNTPCQSQLPVGLVHSTLEREVHRHRRPGLDMSSMFEAPFVVFALPKTRLPRLLIPHYLNVDGLKRSGRQARASRRHHLGPDRHCPPRHRQVFLTHVSTFQRRPLASNICLTHYPPCCRHTL
jgi:hypothetical protein